MFQFLNISTTVIVLKLRKTALTRSHYSECSKYTKRSMASVHAVIRPAIQNMSVCEQSTTAVLTT